MEENSKFYRRQKTKTHFKARHWLFFMFLMVLVVNIGLFSAQDWTIEGDKVYYEDAKVYLSAEPHTLSQSGWVYFNVTSKVYTGDIDVVFGFNTEFARPKKIELYKPTTRNVPHAFACDFEDSYFNYTVSPKHFWCYLNESNGTGMQLIYERDFEWGNLPAKIAYWNVSSVTEWKDYSQTAFTINHNYKDMNRWVYFKNVPIVEDKGYFFRGYINIPIRMDGSGGKYWFAIKPSGETIQEAISSGHLYYLDPWWNSSFTYKRDIIGLNETLYLPLNGSSNITLTAGDVSWIYGKGEGANPALYYNDSNITSVANDTNEQFFVQTLPKPRSGGIMDPRLVLWAPLDEMAGGTIHGFGADNYTNNLGGTTIEEYGIDKGKMHGGYKINELGVLGNINVSGNQPFDGDSGTVILWLDSKQGLKDLDPDTQNIIDCGTTNKYHVKFSNALEKTNIRIGSTEVFNWVAYPEFTAGEVFMFTLSWNISGASHKIYKNGTLVASSSGGSAAAFSNFFVGSRNDGALPWNGTIYDIKIYDRVLSLTEIQTLYDMGTSLGDEEVDTGGTETNSVTWNVSSIETKYEEFILNFTTEALNVTNPIFSYNDTNYTGTLTAVGPDWILTGGMDIPLNEQNNSFYFAATLDGVTTIFSNNYGQNVTSICMGDTICSSSEFMRINYRDEINYSYISANNPTFDYDYWSFFGTGSVRRSVSIINNTAHIARILYAYPIGDYFNMEYNISYTTDNYPQRSSGANFTYMSPGAAGEHNQTFYLLHTSDGLYVTFQVVGPSEQPLDGVHVNATALVGGVTTLVGDGYTGADGGITFYLNPNAAHVFNFYLSNYALYSLSLVPTQSSYTIMLGSSIVEAEEDFTKGVSYMVQPQSMVLINNTVYDFNFTTSSNFWTISEFGFTLTNSSGYVINSTSDNTNGGTVEVTTNTENHGEITMNYYWIIDGNYTNASRSWLVYDESGSDWSILNFFNNLSTYITSGLFGLDNFGLAILTFLFMFVFTGVLSYKFGLTSPAALFSVVFGIILLLDVSFNLIPNLNGYPFATILTGLILFALMVREVT